MSKKPSRNLAGKCGRCGIIATMTVCLISSMPANATENVNEGDLVDLNTVVSVNADSENENNENTALSTMNVKASRQKTSSEPAWGLWTRVNNSIHQRVDLNDPSNVETAEHVWDKGVVTTEATCTSKGLMTFTCEECGAFRTETIAALGHKWEKWTRVDDTVHQRLCSRDHSHVETARHTWDAGKITRQPTATETGARVYSCSGCGATREEVIPATGSGSGSGASSSTPSSSSQGSSSSSRPASSTPTSSQTSSPTQPSASSSRTQNASGGEQEQSGNNQTAQAVNVSYSCTAGNEIQWAKGTSSSANFTFKRSEDANRTVDHFTTLKVDGKELTASEYEKQPGEGLTLKLLPAYLETLTSGSHIVVASFDDGQPVSAKFTITASGQSATTSNTSRPANSTSPQSNANANSDANRNMATQNANQQQSQQPADPQQATGGPVEKGVPMVAAAAVSMIALPLTRKFKRPGLF